jgi:hypothetical protein
MDSPHFRAVEELAAEMRAELPARENPMLVRVLFEALFDRLWNKRYTASLFLMAVPYKEVVSRHVARLAEDHPRRDVRDAAVALSLRTGGVAALPTAQAWATTADPARQATGLVTLGHWGNDLDPALLEPALGADWDVARRALYAAGMSGSPVLRDWADDPSRSDRVRAAAQWWMRVGSRVET